ncbi:unnamed protein product [Prorocentrum cordatum]|uniref:Uncharacterized protein n=1 Tax=Prorocentrum cordatum TaxID=2364126 RepID=A0ABN9RRN1_9DINO|nr:unnamed protein product [Polarella glacialis]
MSGKTCDSYCKDSNLACMRAAEEVDDDCTEKQELECAAAFPDTSDLICQCAVRDIAKATTLSQDASLGDTTIFVTDTQHFAPGDYIEISMGDFYETQVVVSIGTGAGTQNAATTIRRLQTQPSIIVKWPLKNAYGRGSNVVLLIEGAVDGDAPIHGTDVAPLDIEADTVTCKDRLKWPDRDTDADECGTCKFRVSLSNFRSCDTYCASFAQECFYAADVKISGNGDRSSCSAKSVVSCRDDIASMDSGSEDMICGCRFSKGVVKKCKPVDQWPHIDGEADCGTCKHIVNFNGDYRSCGEYCKSFGQECFYAAEDKNGPGGDDGECEVLEDFACSTNTQTTNDLICGCQHPQDDCPSFEEWPDKDGETSCGTCKHLVAMDHHETCESYCGSFGQRCFYAALQASGSDSNGRCMAEEEVTCTDNMKLIQPNSHSMICGCANIETVGPTPAPTIAPPPPLPNTTCRDFSLWPDPDGTADCGLCKHLVTLDTYSSCEAYCASFQQECFFAAEDVDDVSCEVKQEVPCRRDLKALQDFNSNDMICGCRDPQEAPKRCKDFSVWPDKDNDVSCGTCKHLVLVQDYKTCNDYCESFDQRCFYAALDHDGPGGDMGQCRIERDVSCDTNMRALQVNSNDMICGCEHKEEACDEPDLWPDLDSHVKCGTCTHLVKMTEHKSCQGYCNSFGHTCFYAAQSENDNDVTVHHDGCSALLEVSCAEDMSHFMPSNNDMICGCTTAAASVTTSTPAVPQPQPSDGFGCKPFVKWPDKQGGNTCGECKHRVEPANFKSCGTYCESFGQECFYSAVADASGDSCLVDSTITCRTDVAALGMDHYDLICGCRNPQAPPKGCRDFAEWPDKDGSVDCGPCKHLVLVGQHASCDEYCQSFQQECFYAAEDRNGPGGDTGECAVLADVTCSTNLAEMQVNSNDMICGCQNPPPECKDFSQWPDKDGDITCGDCKHLVTMDNYNSCDSYCASFGQVCFYAAQDKVGADPTVHADGCAIKVEVLCSDDQSGFPNTKDMICGCANPPATTIASTPAPPITPATPATPATPVTPPAPPASGGTVPTLSTTTCKDFGEWPDKDGTGDCGVCRHLVKVSPDLRTCEDYCKSFGQECFFAAEDKNGASGDTGMCIVDKTFSCRDDMLAVQMNSQDMICGCKDPVEPPKQCKGFDEWPGGDGKAVCGECRHQVTPGVSTNCDQYCQGFQQECFYAAEALAGSECETGQHMPTINEAMLHSKGQQSRKVINKVLKFNIAYSVCRHLTREYCGDLLSQIGTESGPPDPPPPADVIGNAVASPSVDTLTAQVSALQEQPYLSCVACMAY